MKKIISLLLCMTMAVLMTGSLAFADEAEGMLNPEEMAAAADETEDVLTPEELAEAAQEESAGPASPYEQMMSDENLKTVEAPLSENGEIEIEDYSVIEIPSIEVEVTEDDVNNNLTSMLSFATTTEAVMEGTAQEGDTVNIDFTGYLEGEEEPFEGGSAVGYDLSLGSGMFIPGFEEQVIGHEIGETFDINVTFPEMYTEDLAGKNATFTVTLNHKTVTVAPELNDEFAKNFAAENLGEEINTVDELKDYIRKTLEKNLLDNAIMKRMQDKTNVISYKESQFNMLKEYYLADLSNYVEMYAAAGMEGVDADSIANMSGFADAQSYASDETMYYMNIIMMLDKVAEDKGIEVTDAEIDEVITKFMTGYGYDETYSIEEFKELNGETWVFLMSKLNVLSSKVVESLHDNVVFTEAVEEAPAEEVSAAEDEAE